MKVKQFGKLLNAATKRRRYSLWMIIIFKAFFTAKASIKAQNLQTYLKQKIFYFGGLRALNQYLAARETYKHLFTIKYCMLCRPIALSIGSTIPFTWKCFIPSVRVVLTNVQYSAKSTPTILPNQTFY